MKLIRLIHWKDKEAAVRLRVLRGAGYDARHDEFSPALLRDMRAHPPDGVVIDLTRLPSHGRDVALTIRQMRALRRVPLVFVEGDPGKVKRIKQLLPDASYATWQDIHSVLRRAIAHPPEEPIVPKSRLAGYAGTPLPEKLGIKAGMIIAVVNAPEGFAEMLGPLPDRAMLRWNIRGRHDLTIWFVRSGKALERRIGRMAEVSGDSLWIAWPKKTSDVASDLTQSGVRRIGLDRGLVDYKVCAIDETWSGLKFTRRKQE
jgi:hypothetical protein